MEVAKELAKQARQLNICVPWYNELKTLNDKREMLRMYIKGIDFCLSNDFPSNEYIRDNFKGVMEEFGVFLDENIDLLNSKICVALGATNGRIEINNYGTAEIFLKHNSILEILVKDNAFVMVDAFDDTVAKVKAFGNAKICINRYGKSKIIAQHEETAMVKIIDKHKKTY